MMRLSLLSAVVVAAARAALRSDASAGGAGGAGLTLVPGAQSGMLIDIQFLNPHAYGPNEPFSQEWVYEGLVSYAEGGVLRPALATGWSVSSPSPAPSPADGRVNITFALRQGVTFHDGAPWNAEACKINFDNVFSPALTAGYHSWYQLPASVVRWYAVDEFTFTITLAAPYYPAVQELTYVRPLRFLSPAAFFTGTDSSGRAYNSCPVARGVQTGNNVSVACAGIRMPAGTGPLQFAAKVTNQRTLTPQDVSTTALLPGETVSHILFERFERYWGGAVPLASVTTPANLNSSAVKEGLLDGSIHMAYGAATLSPVDFVELRDRYPQAVRTFLSDPLQTRALLLHTGRDATASIAVRRAVNAALDKAAIRAALSLLELPADRLFATDMPYCNVDIGPLPAFSPAAADSLLAADGWVYPGPGATVRAKAGVPLQLTLLYVSTDPVHSLLVSVLLPQLAAVGVGVTAVGMAKQAFNAAMFAGNFSMGIIETTGAPYDPHSYAAAWRTPRSFEFPAMAGMGAASGMSQRALWDNITAVLGSTEEGARQALWQAVLTAVNAEAVFAPLTYVRNRAVLNKAVAGFQFGSALYDVPVAGLNLLTSSAESSRAAAVPPVLVFVLVAAAMVKAALECI